MTTKRKAKELESNLNNAILKYFSQQGLTDSAEVLRKEARLKRKRADADILDLNLLFQSRDSINEEEEDTTSCASVEISKKKKNKKKKAKKRKKSNSVADTNLHTMRVEKVEVRVGDSVGITYEVDDTPDFMKARYFLPSKISIYRRDSYESLYRQLKDIILSPRPQPVMLITGVPGIGKSFFSIFFMIELLLDETFPLESFVVEYYFGKYKRVSLVSMITISERRCDLTVSIEDVSEIDVNKDLLLSDLKQEMEPKEGGKWTIIFSSPIKKRYKETLKAPHHFRFLMPTWAQEELLFLDANEISWYDHFVIFGGVPRRVFWKEGKEELMSELTEALREKGEKLIDSFSQYGFGAIDSEHSYLLIHINPLWDRNRRDWRYTGEKVYNFASDYIFKELVKINKTKLLSLPKDLFNAGLALSTYGGGSAGNLFEKMVLWLEPLETRRVQLISLKNESHRILITLPAMRLLDREWKTAANLQAGVLYQPQICCMESGDSFGVVRLGNEWWLVVFQVTVGSQHPVKANGLVSILMAYPPQVRGLIHKKLLVFVTPRDGALNSVQPFHNQKDKVVEKIPQQIKDFEQYVCRYDLTSNLPDRS